MTLSEGMVWFAGAKVATTQAAGQGGELILVRVVLFRGQRSLRQPLQHLQERLDCTSSAGSAGGASVA